MWDLFPSAFISHRPYEKKKQDFPETIKVPTFLQALKSGQLSQRNSNDN